jgi:hypothetical protein
VELSISSMATGEDLNTGGNAMVSWRTFLLHANTKDIIVETPSLRIVLLEGFKLK